MDLSTGGDIDAIRQAILDASPVPVGTVPIYQAVTEVKRVEDLTADDLLDMVEHQAQQGVDYVTVHCGILRERSEEHTSELQSLAYLVCRLLLEKKKKKRPCHHEGCKNSIP